MWQRIYIFFLFLQGSITSSRGSDLNDHSIKANGSHASYSDDSATSHINGKTSLEEFEGIIHSMAQVKSHEGCNFAQKENQPPNISEF